MSSNTEGPDEGANYDEMKDKLAAAQLNVGARSILPDVIRCLRMSPLHDASYAYTYRVKKADRIIEKVKDRRSKPETPHYGPNDVTDILGIRVITLFYDELGPTAQDIAQLLTGRAALEPNRLKATRILEAKIYTTPQTEYAMPVDKLENILNEELGEHLAPGKKVKTERRGDYSSIHIVAMVPVEKESEDGVEELPVEIQLRTVFEDTWAQIDHKLRYSRTRTKNTEKRHNVSVAAERHLPVLKRYLDSCSDYAEIIRQHLETPTLQKGGQLEPIDGYTEFKRRAQDLKVNEEIATELLELLKAKERLDEDYKKNRNSKPEDFDLKKLRKTQEGYAKLAEDLKKIFQDHRLHNGYLSPVKMNLEPNRFLAFSLRMEEAYCRTRSDKPDEKTEAVRIYRSLADLMNENAIVYLRLGQGESKEGRYDKASAAFARAEELMLELEDKSAEERGWHLTDVQMQYVKQELHRLWGFANWKWSQGEDLPVHGKAQHLCDAVEVTLRGFGHLEQDNRGFRLLNNLYYYIGDLEALPEDVSASALAKLSDLSWEEEHRQEFIDHVLGQDNPDVRMLNTVAKLLARHGHMEEALVQAKRVMDICMKPETRERFGDEETDFVSRDAWDILRNAGKT